jgi:hypothetical protein
MSREAADPYRTGRSLARIAVYVGGFSPTTVARALKKAGVSLRPRPGS